MNTIAALRVYTGAKHLVAVSDVHDLEAANDLVRRSYPGARVVVTLVPKHRRATEHNLSTKESKQ